MGLALRKPAPRRLYSQVVQIIKCARLGLQFLSSFPPSPTSFSTSSTTMITGGMRVRMRRWSANSPTKPPAPPQSGAMSPFIPKTEQARIRAAPKSDTEAAIVLARRMRKAERDERTDITRVLTPPKTYVLSICIRGRYLVCRNGSAAFVIPLPGRLLMHHCLVQV